MRCCSAVQLQIFFVYRHVIGQRPVLTTQKANLAGQNANQYEEFKFQGECSIGTFGNIFNYISDDINLNYTK